MSLFEIEIEIEIDIVLEPRVGLIVIGRLLAVRIGCKLLGFKS